MEDQFFHQFHNSLLKILHLFLDLFITVFTSISSDRRSIKFISAFKSKNLLFKKKSINVKLLI